MTESPVQVLSREETDRYIDDFHESAAKVCRMYRRGYLGDDDLRERLQNLVFADLERFMRDRNLKIRIAAADWPVFREAVSAWRKDDDAEHLRACSWLYFQGNDEARGIHWGDEASAADKALLLKILDACSIPVEYYRPVPEGIVCPDDHPGHFPTESVVGFRIWESDEGLAAGDFRIGEEKILTDRLGLKAVLRIDRYTPKEQQDRNHDSDFEATGTIEGYTSARPRKIKVYLDYRRKRIDYLKFLMERDDFLLDFPLWRQYRKDRAKIRKIGEQVLRDVLEEYGRE